MNEIRMEEVVAEENLRQALAAVKRNRGAAGIDRMATTELEAHLDRHWVRIREKLIERRYVPSPVRRVEIPKPSGGTRTLGIPTVMDRLIQQMLLQAMTPVFDPEFSEHSYGFRPGRSAQQAVQAAQEMAREGRDWVVDIDITKFFDHVNHDILMSGIGKRIRDKRVLGLIGKFLRRGAMADGVMIPAEEGTPQGGPLSPLLANIYLDALDKELEKRGHAFVRYADDCNIYVGSRAAAERTMASVTEFIERKLRLKVNAAKSGVGRAWERKFLGFCLTATFAIVIARESIQRFKQKVRELWRSRPSRTEEQLRKEWLRFMRGWWNYFQLAEERRGISRLEGWIRRHIRKSYWLRWHSAEGRQRHLRELGLSIREQGIARAGRGAWRIAKSYPMHRALSNVTLRSWGFLMPTDLAT